MAGGLGGGEGGRVRSVEITPSTSIEGSASKTGDSTRGRGARPLPLSRAVMRGGEADASDGPGLARSSNVGVAGAGE